MTPLITDFLFFAVLGILVYGFVRSLKHPLWRQAYHELGQSSVAVVCVVVLSFYCLVGALDSIRFRSTAHLHPITVLDVIMAPQSFDSEHSYSAPFATELLNKTVTMDNTGRFQETSPRLKHGGDQLADPNNTRAKYTDILKTSAWSVCLSGLILAALLLIVKKIPYCRKLNDCIDQKSLWISVSVLITLVVIACNLKTHYHLFGTDKIGRDVLYLSLKSIRTGLLVGGITLSIAVPIATVLGVFAGYRGGWFDDGVQFVYTVIYSVPGILLIAACVLALQTKLEEAGDLRLLLLCLVLGFTGWTGLCRLLRAETLKIRDLEYIQVARLLGCRTPALVFKYILPNIFHLILISVALDFSGLVLVEAILSYVGIGVDASTMSWGTLINSARLELAGEPVVWWSLAATLVLMSLLVVAINLLADELQKTLDPRRHYAT